METVCAEDFCYKDRGYFTGDWRIYTRVKNNGGILISYHAPDFLSDDLIKYKRKIADYLSSNFPGVRYHDFTNLKVYGTTFETDSDFTAVTDMKALLDTVDTEVVDIIKPLWEKFEQKKFFLKVQGYEIPNMKALL